MWKLSNFRTLFTRFSHTFHMNFIHISHACEILHSEIYVKCVWNDVNPVTHIFTYTSHGVSHRLSHVTPHWMAKEFQMVLTCKFTHIFTYTSNGVSHVLSHASNPHWMAKDLVFHMLLIHTYFHIHFTWGFTWAFTCKSPVIMNGSRIPHATQLFSKSTRSIQTQIYTCNKNCLMYSQLHAYSCVHI